MTDFEVLYKGDGFQIIEADGDTVFKIASEASEITYSFLKDAIDEYERYKSKRT